jgi:tetratricopeptide (TPR) repeat protein
MHSIDASRGLRMPWPDWICRTTRRPQPDLRKAGEYCEQLHDDDRAGFYDCLNSRVKSSAGPAILRRLGAFTQGSDDAVAVPVVGAPASDADRASGRKMFDASMAYFGRHEWPEALETLHKALRLDGSVASYHAAVGAVEMVLGHWEDAEAEYTAASLIDVDNAEYRAQIKEGRRHRT